ADIVRRAKLVLSHDTGLQYMAAAFNKPVLAFWGSTSPKLDVEPWTGSGYLSTFPHAASRADGSTPDPDMHKPYENIMVPGLWCQPCSKYGNRRCPLGHFNCMEKMDAAHIAERVNLRLGR